MCGPPAAARIPIVRLQNPFLGAIIFTLPCTWLKRRLASWLCEHKKAACPSAASHLSAESYPGDHD